MTGPKHAQFHPSRTATWSRWVFMIISIVHAQLTDQWWWVPIWFVAWFGFLLVWALIRAVVDVLRERGAP